jgi:hypothetical protein
MMQLMISNDTDSDDVARSIDLHNHEIACVVMIMLSVEWSICTQDRLP